jgi:hypothetical protein
MAISAKTLFHFTRRLKTIELILRNGFWPRYCEETGWGEKHDISWAVPIVCFTDIPLTQIKNHNKDYGSYGIGMKRDWVNRNREICPIWYLNQTSIEIINQLRNSLSDRHISAHYKMFSLLKRIEGEKYFYDEREWRYVPALGNKELGFINLTKRPNSKDELIRESEKTKEYSLKFAPDDIQYLIVKNEGNRDKMIKIIKSVYADEKVVKILSSKILSIEQIRSDF